MDESSTPPATIIKLDEFRDSPPQGTSHIEAPESHKQQESSLDFYIKEEALFRQNIQLDVIHERQLMYRVALVILWVIACILCRQWLLAIF